MHSLQAIYSLDAEGIHVGPAGGDGRRHMRESITDTKSRTSESSTARPHQDGAFGTEPRLVPKEIGTWDVPLGEALKNVRTFQARVVRLAMEAGG